MSLLYCNLNMKNEKIVKGLKFMAEDKQER